MAHDLGSVFPAISPGQPSGRSPFPPIADYAFRSDCEVTCLVAPSGAVEWMCMPRPDSPSIFSAMLDRSAGAFRLGPYDEMVPAARRDRHRPRSSALINAVVHVIQAEKVPTVGPR